MFNATLRRALRETYLGIALEIKLKVTLKLRKLWNGFIREGDLKLYFIFFKIVIDLFYYVFYVRSLFKNRAMKEFLDFLLDRRYENLVTSFIYLYIYQVHSTYLYKTNIDGTLTTPLRFKLFHTSALARAVRHSPFNRYPHNDS